MDSDSSLEINFDSDLDSGLDRGEGLRDHLAKLVVKRSFDQKPFLPYGCIDAVITREAVRQELGSGSSRLSVEAGKTGQEDQDSLVDFMMLESKPIFAILICCHLDSHQIQEAMTQFRSHGLNDSELSIMFEDGGSPPSIFYSSFQKAHRKPWNHLPVKTFCFEAQWMFLTPSFLLLENQVGPQSNTICFSP
ncbi:hypothetical protein LA080_005065 [Diaporthe eres]|nr:hypothetical protein LA080_005065 [Diaporthe eres]